MTTPNDGGPLAPARRNRTRLGGSFEQPLPGDYTEAEVLQGQSAAVLAALARMQLRLDVMAREQSEQLARVVDLVETMYAMVVEDAASYAASHQPHPTPEG